jgi:hypothetical protein
MRLALVEREHLRALQRAHVQAGLVEHPSYDGEVLGLAGVARGGQRHLLVVGRLPAGFEQADGLKRLVGAAREDRPVDVTEREQRGPVRAERDDRAGMRAFDVPRADDLGEDRQGQDCSLRIVATSASPSL